MTNRRTAAALCALAVLLTTVAARTAADDPPEYGPPKGTLVIVGGGSHEGTGIIEKFIELAGGPDAKFVIVPTAGGNRNPDGTVRATYKEEDIVAPWLKRGLKNVRMLHTHDPKVADTEAFAKVLRDGRTPSGSTAAASGTSSTRTRTR